MSERPSALPQLTRQALDVRLSTGRVTEQDLEVLHWLVWLSLLSTWELARVMRKDERTIWTHLDRLVGLDLVDQVVLNEPGWPRRHHRYHVTDLGLYVLSASHPQPLSARKIAMSYPVCRCDLLERLARPQVHLVLCEFVTRLIAERPAGYRLTSYQQPFKQAYTDVHGRNHTITFDAAFLLKVPEGTQHALYVRVDQPERLFSQKETRTFLRKVLALRQASRLEGEVMPHLLLLSSPERFSFWAEHLERITLQQGISLLDGAIADSQQLRQGVYAPIWIPFCPLTKHAVRAQGNDLTSLLAFLDRKASSRLVERFSQYFTFQHLLLQRDNGARSRRKNALTLYVESPLLAAATVLLGAAAKPQVNAQQDTTELTALIAETFHSHLEDRLFMSTVLSLTLSDQQKQILAHLARHPYLNRAGLLTLLHPEAEDERLITRQITPLIKLKLVDIFPWREASTWQERERYFLCEPALRYLAVRHGLSPAYYLVPILSEEQDGRTVSPLARDVKWLQRGAWGLRAQMAHTSRLYQCVRSILAAAYSTGSYQVAFWKSARESTRWYSDPVSHEVVFIRPDAELLVTTGDDPFPQSVLIEYDRGTTSGREYERKFRSYSDYQHETRTSLPRILVITQNQQTTEMISRAISTEHAFDLRVAIVLEAQVLQEGLSTLLKTQLQK